MSDRLFSISIPTTTATATAGTGDVLYGYVPTPGLYKVTHIGFLPITDVAADATDYVSIAFAVGATTLATTRTTETVAMTAGTVDVQTLATGVVLEITGASEAIKVTITKGGSGKAFEGTFGVAFERIGD